MKISQEELQRRLNDPNNLAKTLSEKNPLSPKTRGNDSDNRNNAGRKEGDKNAPKSLRVVAGVLAKAENNSAGVARELELSPGQVRYARDTKLTEKRVQEVALDRLMDALGLLDATNISGEKPKDISTIAANLSRVHANLRPRDSAEGTAVNITIYSPKQKNVQDYEIVEVQATGT